jgi:hypothetical protein
MPDPSLALVIIFSMLAVMAIIFLAPFSISLNFSKDGPLVQGFYRIGWLGITLRKGVISPPEETMKAPIVEPAEEKAKEKAEKKVEEKAKEIPKEEHKPHHMAGPDPKELIEALPALTQVFMDLIRSISMERISCRLSFGLDDPADTAAMSGYLWSIASVIGLYRANIYIEPYFEGERLDGSLLAEVKARLLWIALVLVKALGEKKIRRLIIETARRETAMREPAGGETA